MAEQTVEAMLRDYEAKRQHLDIVIAALRAQLGQAPAPDAPAIGATLPAFAPASVANTPGTIRSDEFFGMTIPDAIKAYLEIMKQPQKPQAIADALKRGGLLSEAKSFSSAIWTALTRLKNQGEIVNMKQGWAPAGWYKGRSGATEPKKAAAKGKKPSRRTAAKKTAKKAANKRTSKAGNDTSSQPLLLKA